MIVTVSAMLCQGGSRCLHPLQLDTHDIILGYKIEKASMFYSNDANSGTAGLEWKDFCESATTLSLQFTRRLTFGELQYNGDDLQQEQQWHGGSCQ